MLNTIRDMLNKTTKTDQTTLEYSKRTKGPVWGTLDLDMFLEGN